MLLCSWPDALQSSSPKYSVLPVLGEGADKPLFVEKGNHCLLNEFGIYVLDELHTFQNMATLRMPDKSKLTGFMESRIRLVSMD